ncbi:guanine nucleotide-binding protein subunit beta [Sphaceloma murrayae]|uniref:Guanine nucleotide-binding protein subunit beta n=1 Tax=Sphaceloma murrayae TaxID=2082308 RepID=A0A2K1QHC0_9PEZI|nr:guanine nucleotide-binding protein subunit beta [Sphaceloma murrayae]
MTQPVQTTIPAGFTSTSARATPDTTSTTSSLTSPPSTTSTSTTTSTSLSTTSVSPVSSGSCGLHGYDLQKPAASYVDSTGQYGALAVCRTLCAAQPSVLSFAFGSNTCLCYQATVDGNLNPVEDSPYAFYDLTCGSDGDNASTTPALTSATSATTSAKGACATQPEDGTYCGFINPEDPCAPQPDGHGPDNLTVDAFMNSADFKQVSTSAPTSVSGKSGAVYAQVFSNLQAAVSANSYLGLHTLYAYDVSACAAFCEDTSLCTSFNIYIERDPSLNPTKNDSTASTVWGYWCPNPEAITNYKCTLWGSNLDASMATNKGQWRRDFEVVITGSNGYDKTNSTTPTCEITSALPSPTGVTSSIVSTTTLGITTTLTSTSAFSSTTTAISTSRASTLTTSIKSSTTTKLSASASATNPTVPKWKKGRNCNGKAVNNPKRWMGSKVFPGPYNPQVCADYAWAQNAANKAAAIRGGKRLWQPCKYVNAVYYHKNGIPFGTYCNLYDVALSSEFETYTGGVVGGDNYSTRQSWTFELDVDSNFDKC